MKRNISTLLVTLLAGLLLQTSAMAADEEEYVAALEKAQNMLSEAATRVQLWSTSEILLEKAAEAAATGDFDEGISLANEAGLHAELAVATAEREKKTWLRNVPK
jgi:uncharacterized UPF0160 family protein